MKLLAGEEEAFFVGEFRESSLWGLKNDTGELEDKVSWNWQRRKGSLVVFSSSTISGSLVTMETDIEQVS